MQDEVNTKVVALTVRVVTKGGKMTADVMKAAMRKWLREQEQIKNIKRQKKMEASKHGKQTVGKLMEQNQGLTNIEITDDNIKSFERVANKYNIDFALTKDKASKVPKYVVFFKARDIDVMTAAFKEYSSFALQKQKKPSLRQKLSKAITQTKQKSQQHDKNRQRQKTRGQER